MNYLRISFCNVRTSFIFTKLNCILFIRILLFNSSHCLWAKYYYNISNLMRALALISLVNWKRKLIARITRKEKQLRSFLSLCAPIKFRSILFTISKKKSSRYIIQLNYIIEIKLN